MRKRAKNHFGPGVFIPEDTFMSLRQSEQCYESNSAILADMQENVIFVIRVDSGEVIVVRNQGDSYKLTMALNGLPGSDVAKCIGELGVCLRERSEYGAGDS